MALSLDLGLTLLALRLAKWLREIIPWGVTLDQPLQFSPWLYLIVPGVWLAVFGALHVYHPARTLRRGVHLPAVWAAAAAACLIFTGIAYLLFRDLSRFLVFYFFMLDLCFLSAWRWLLPRLPGLTGRLAGAAERRVLIAGAGPVGQKLARVLSDAPDSYLKVVGFVDPDPTPAEFDHLSQPLLGSLNLLPGLVRSQEIHEVIFALPPEQSAELRRAVMSLQPLPVNLRLVPDVFDLVFIRASVEEFAGIPIIGLREPVLAGSNRLIKRLFDLALSLLLLLALSPLLLVIGLLIKLDSSGPVFFRQQRVGEKGRLFWMVKFRSMVDGADRSERQLLQQTAEGLPLFAKSPADSRITRVGQVLRRTSLDELPQLWNVLRGEMSLVGPRPELPGLVALYEPWQHRRFAVPQGMTGWWQVNGRMRRATPQQRAEDDLFYIRNYSLWLDLRILWKTIQTVIQGEGAY